MNWQQRWLVTSRRTWPGFVVVAAVYAVMTFSLAPFQAQIHLSTVVLAYLLVTLLASAVWGYRVGFASAVAADLAVNFLFVEPLHRFAVQQPQNVAALLVYLAVAMTGASMRALLRRQALLADARRVEATLLLDLTREVAHAVSARDALQRLCSAVTRAVGVRGCAILRNDDGSWRVIASTGSLVLTREDESMAGEAVRTGETVRFSSALPGSRRKGPGARPESLVFVPFERATRVAGVLRLSGPLSAPPLVEVPRLLEAFANEAATAAERARLSEEGARIELLKRADQLKTTILSSVSHDLRSPLTAIKAAASSLRDDSVGWTNDDREGFLATIESQTDALACTVDNLLAMSRLDGGSVEPLFEPIEVEPLLSETLLEMAEELRGRPSRVEGASGLWVRGDYGLLCQALKNLVQNACRYSVPGGAIVLSAEPAGRSVRISVCDTGPGIPAEDLMHIFEKFYRGSNAARARGTGLGLSITKSITQLCGGRVSATSGPGGARFTIELPAALSPAQ